MPYAIIQRAIEEKRSLTAYYDNYVRHFSAHIGSTARPGPAPSAGSMAAAAAAGCRRRATGASSMSGASPTSSPTKTAGMPARRAASRASRSPASTSRLRDKGDTKKAAETGGPLRG